MWLGVISQTLFTADATIPLIGFLASQNCKFQNNFQSDFMAIKTDWNRSCTEEKETAAKSAEGETSERNSLRNFTSFYFFIYVLNISWPICQKSGVPLWRPEIV